MEQMGFIWIDWCVIGFIALSGVIGLWRGFFKECLSVVIWVLAITVAWLFADPLARAFDGIISSYAVRFTIAAVVLAIIVLVIGALISMLVSKLISVTGLSGSDRLLGLIFGIFRGVVVITILVGILIYMPLRDTIWWQTSALIPKFEQLAVWSKEVVTNKVAPLLRQDMLQQNIPDNVDDHTGESENS